MARCGANSSVSTPRVHMPEIAEAAPAQLRHQRDGRDHRHGRRGMEVPQHRVAPGLRDREARRDVFRKPRRVARRERQAVAQAIGARGRRRSFLRSRYGSRRARRPGCGGRSRAGWAAPDAGWNRSAARTSGNLPASGNRPRRPAPLALAASDVNVRTTPLTCGCHASVAISTRIKRLPFGGVGPPSSGVEARECN